MTVTDRTAATDAEFRSRIAPFESAPTPPEVREAAVIAAVTEALLITVLGTDDRDFLTGCGELPVDEIARLVVEYGAAAAVAAYRAAQDGGAEEAVRRVEALCDVADDQPDGYECQFIATRVLRDAIAGELR